MDLICRYGSDSESPDEEDKNGEAAQKAAASEASLPSAHELLGERTSNASPQSLEDVHQGRLRSFPHVEGNYATLIFITVPVVPSSRAPLEKLLNAVREKLPELKPMLATHRKQPTTHGAVSTAVSMSMAQSEYHLSVSRPAPVRLGQIDMIQAALKRNMRRLEPFEVTIGDGIEVFVNDDRTRTFLALRAGGQHVGGRESDRGCPFDVMTSASNPLLRVIESTSNVLVCHGLERYYDDARPHVSIAWLLGDRSEELRAVLRCSSIASCVMEVQQCCWTFLPQAIVFRAGQHCFDVWKCPASVSVE